MRKWDIEVSPFRYFTASSPSDSFYSDYQEQPEYFRLDSVRKRLDWISKKLIVFIDDHSRRQLKPNIYFKLATIIPIVKECQA